MLLLGVLFSGGCATTLNAPMVAKIEQAAIEGLYPLDNVYSPPTTSERQQDLMRLEEIAQAMGIGIMRNNDLQQTDFWGASNRALRIIRLPSYEQVKVDGQWEILAHELAHFFHPPEMTTPTREAYCELVVATMSHELGHPYPYVGPYLTQYKEGLAGAKLYGREIKETALILLGRKPLPERLKVKNDAS